MIETTFIMMEEKVEKLNINVKNPFTEFDKHLNSFGNSRIFFSAPFGQGKTYFLEHFFKEKSLNYEVFKVFPVNYSVATNQDIFRYIKTDILFQLLNKEYDWESSLGKEMELSYLEQICLKKDQFILEFFKLASLLDKRIDTFSKVAESFSSLVNLFKKQEPSKGKEDQTSVGNYMETLFKEEGSIFEDDIYTQLIRTILLRIKVKQEKETILIIEDLDRMDPDHIFRILNVISAHYDNPHFPDEGNKFGFDKIIIVADKKNIENIFHHKYGDRTDFNGYISKYFTSKPFDFDNQEELMIFLNDRYFKVERGFKQSPFAEAYKFILDSMLQTRSINLRELLKVTKFNFENFNAPTFKNNNGYLLSKNLFFKALTHLIFCFGRDRMLQIISKLKAEIVDIETASYDSYCRCLIPLYMHPNGTFDHKGISLKGQIESEFSYDFPKVKILDPQTGWTFKSSDFYYYLEKYAILLSECDLIYK